MFDVYLSNKRDHILVVAKGDRIPSGIKPLGWRKKRAAFSVSAQIKAIVEKDGYYRRKLSKSKTGSRQAPGV